jgi:hypothetical protein
LPSAQGGAQPGDRPTLASPDLEPEFTLVNQITTGPATAQAEVHVDMVPGERRLRLLARCPRAARPKRCASMWTTRPITPPARPRQRAA